MNPTSMAHSLRRRGLKHMGVDPFTPHDLRRMAATGIARLGFPNEVIARVLNHKIRGITAVYNRYQYDDQVVEAMNAWSDMLTSKILKLNG